MENNCPHPNLADKEDKDDWLSKGKDAPNKPPANDESDSDEPEWASMVEELEDLNRMRQEANSTPARAPDEEEPVGVQHYIWLLTQIVLLTSWAPNSFHGFCVRPMCKVKMSKLAAMDSGQVAEASKIPKNFREVMLADSPVRKIIGAILARKALEYVKQVGLHHGVQLGFLPGLCPARVNHMKVHMARHWSTTSGSNNEIIVLYDWVSFFSYVTKANTERAYDHLDLPTHIRRGLEALGSDKHISLTLQCKVHDPVIMQNDVQACSESCFNTIAVTLEFCAAVAKLADDRGVGFQLPRMLDNAPCFGGVMQVDDLQTCGWWCREIS